MILTLLSIIVFVSSIALIGLVAAQTTKSEGLAGAIGGGVQATSKYLPGSEEVLQRYTTYSAIIWMVSCLLWFIVSNHR